jgi:hypothetical protein
MKVEIEVLRSAINQLLDHAKEIAGDSIEVDADLYWHVQRDELNDPNAQPKALTLGSLADDWAEMRALAERTSDPIGYGLVWASTVLRAIGDRVP